MAESYQSGSSPSEAMSPGQSATQEDQSGYQQGQQGQTGQPSQGQPGMSSSRESSQSTAQNKQKAESQKQGTIRSVDSESKTLSLRGTRMHNKFEWSNDTEVLRNGKKVSANDLKKGERVSVSYRKEGDRLIAQQIVIQERQQARAGRHSHQGR